MPDASLVWSGDLTLGPTGDLNMATGSSVTQQRVLRRLLTNAFGDTWHSTYGGGLGRFVGGVADPRAIEAMIRAQMYQESAVAHQPEPVITTDQLPDGGILVNISYADAAYSGTQSLTFSVGA